MKTYADALISPTLHRRLLIGSCNGTMTLAIFFILGVDKSLADTLGKLFGIDVATSYWLVYLLGSICVLLTNLYFTWSEIHGCSLDPNDLGRVRHFIFQDRPVYNFTTRRKEMTKVPRYVFVFIGFLFLFGIWHAVDVLVFSPLDRLVADGANKYIFKFDSGTIYSLFIFSAFPSYIFLLMMILSSRIMSNFKQWMR
ncbi:hypothetical protein ACR2R6_03795 [Methylocaldum gracile subsp. desertum]|uniref:hypothetical protein n=1 Tax=Methylocaldum sp. GT1BW TaxID=3438964 RepID=UPI003DA0F135